MWCLKLWSNLVKLKFNKESVGFFDFSYFLTTTCRISRNVVQEPLILYDALRVGASEWLVGDADARWLL